MFIPKSGEREGLRNNYDYSVFMITKRPNLSSDIVSLLANLPEKGQPVGTVYAPQVKEPLKDFPYYRQDRGVHFLGTVDRAHVGDLALAVSEAIGERYCVLTEQTAYDKVFVDPETIKDPIMKEIAENAWTHTRTARKGNNIFPDPFVRYIDNEFRIFGKSVEVEVDVDDSLSTLVRAGLFKKTEGRGVDSGNIWGDPASLWVFYDVIKGAFCASAPPLGYGACRNVALLERTDEVQ